MPYRPPLPVSGVKASLNICGPDSFSDIFSKGINPDVVANFGDDRSVSWPHALTTPNFHTDSVFFNVDPFCEGIRETYMRCIVSKICSS